VSGINRKGRRPCNIVAAALRSKMARIAWAMLAHESTYETNHISVRLCSSTRRSKRQGTGGLLGLIPCDGKTDQSDRKNANLNTAKYLKRATEMRTFLANSIRARELRFALRAGYSGMASSHPR
jgi:hypothetical protein